MEEIHLANDNIAFIKLEAVTSVLLQPKKATIYILGENDPYVVSTEEGKRIVKLCQNL